MVMTKSQLSSDDECEERGTGRQHVEQVAEHVSDTDTYSGAKKSI